NMDVEETGSINNENLDAIENENEEEIVDDSEERELVVNDSCSTKVLDATDQPRDSYWYWMYKFRDVTPPVNFTMEVRKTQFQAEFTSYLNVATAIPNLIFLILNSLYGHLVSVKSRLQGSLLVVTLCFLVTTTFVQIDTDEWQNTFFIITMVTVVIMTGGIVGIASRFSKEYMGAVVSGQSLGGIIAAIAQIISLAFKISPLHSALIYFIIADLMLVTSLIAYIMLYKIDFFTYHILRGTGGMAPNRHREVSMLLVMKKVWVYAFSIFAVFAISMAVYPAVTVLVESHPVTKGTDWNNIFFVPVVNYLIFNVERRNDAAGERHIIIAFIEKPDMEHLTSDDDYNDESNVFKPLNKWLIAVASVLRVIGVPMLMLCNALPRKNLPVLFPWDYEYIMIMIVFAFTNGYLTNIIMINATRKGSLKVTITPPQHKTLTHLPKRPPVDLAFEDLTYKVQEGRKSNVKTILKSVSGRLRSGELTAIMGPSGAGKSTLLNILTGYKTSGMEGSITVNGMERNLSSFRKLSCYIMQDNQLHGNLTVEEAMSVATSLKLPTATTKADKDEVIQEILETLGLAEHHKTMTSNLSGGQKKRLSIALELVNNPPIMFFDEPTSGLDSSSCFQCISLLKTLASGGRTIICTIHQPSARLFEMFDHLYTLADGQCVYQGSTGKLVSWLGSLGLQCPSYHNPASFIIEVSCGEYGDNTGKLVRAIDNGKHDIRNGQPFPDMKLPDLNNKKDMQESLNAEWNKNDLSQVQEKFKEEKANGSNGANGTGNLQNGILQYAANEIAKGKGEPLVVQIESEKQDNTEVALLGVEASPKRYATSELTQFWVVLKRTLLFSRRDWAIFCIIYVVIVYLLTSQPLVWFRFSMFLGSCLLISFVAQSVGLVVGAAMNVQNGVFLAPVMSVPFLLFSGFFVSFNAIPVYLRWITYLSYIRYGFEGTALATYSFNRPNLQCHQPYCHFKDPNTTLEELDMSDADIGLDIAALCAIFLVLRISAFLFLRWKLKSTR
ncbi:hypothetical protein MSG28_006347, partial [Choristoneura fumiferana]